jgi:hypothetical protein
MPTRAVPWWQNFFLFYGDRRNTFGERKKKKNPSLSLLLGFEFLLLDVMAGVVYGGRRRSNWPREKKNKKSSLLMIVLLER